MSYLCHEVFNFISPEIVLCQEVRGNFLFPSAKIQNIYHIENQFIVFFNLISRLPLNRVCWINFWPQTEGSRRNPSWWRSWWKSARFIILYLDFELSEKQFQLRYTNEHGNLYSFPERLYRVFLDCDSLLDANFEEAIIGSIEQMALQTGCRIFIVDNLTYSEYSKAVREVDDVAIGRYEQAQKRGNSMKL